MLGRISQALVAIIVCVVAISRPAGIYWISIYAGAISRPAGIYWISIYAGAIFAVAWLPTIVAALKWRRMSAQAAQACMLVGSISFIVVGELQRHDWISLPAHVDNLMIAIVLGTLALIVVGLWCRPSEYEVASFDALRSQRLSDSTMREFLAREGGARQLVREYRRVWGIMLLFVLIALSLWGYLFVKLGL